MKQLTKAQIAHRERLVREIQVGLQTLLALAAAEERYCDAEELSRAATACLSVHRCIGA